MRLKESFAIPAAWTLHEKAVLKGLKKYGALVADNGNFFSISATPDDRWAGDEFSHLSSISIANFEVIQTTGPNEGPRSPGAPVAHAGTDQTVAPNVAVPLNGTVSATYPVTTQWKVYSGPAAVVFDDASKTNASARFSATGDYILMLSADDGFHAVSYDAIHVSVGTSVGTGINASIQNSGSSVNITWTGAAPPYVIEQTLDVGSRGWTPILTSAVSSATIPFTNAAAFFRIRGQ